MSTVEKMEGKINCFLRKWFGVPKCLATNDLYSSSSKLQLPLKSVLEEYKVGKVRFQLMLRDSKDQAIRDHYPDLRSGKKWTAMEAIDEAEARLQHKDVVGAVQQGRTGLGWKSWRPWAKCGVAERRQRVLGEVRAGEEEVRISAAVQQSQQGRWTRWD